MKKKKGKMKKMKRKVDCTRSRVGFANPMTSLMYGFGKNDVVLEARADRSGL